MGPGRSTTKLWILCSIVLGIGFLAAAYLNYFQYQRSQDTQRQLSGTITDLKYQVEQDAKRKQPEVSQSPTVSPTPSSSPLITPTPLTLPTTVPGAKTTRTNQPAYLHKGANQTSPVLLKLPPNTVK
jgi:hypothetical protein